MISYSNRELSLLKELMRRFIGEVEQGVHPLRAGWIKAEGSEVDALAALGLAEKSKKGIRLHFDEDFRIGPESIPDTEVEELVYICSDLARAVEVEKLITQVADELKNSLHLRIGISILGWWRMLQTSEFPVAVDEVLREGFSPDGWYIEVPKTSLELAITLANKWWKVDIKNAFGHLRGFSFPIPKIPKTEVSNRVKKILRWEEVLNILPQEESEAIAFLWCVDYLCTSKGLRYPQSMDFVQAHGWGIISEKMRSSVLEIMERVEQILDQLPSQSSISWAEIIRFPW